MGPIEVSLSFAVRDQTGGGAGAFALALAPISMAVTDPVGELIGTRVAFLAAGVIPMALAALTLLIARLGPDEPAHSLTDRAMQTRTVTEQVVTGPAAAASLLRARDET